METLKKRINRARAVYETLSPFYPPAKTALHYNTPLELLIATILSAQCTDKKVNEVTKGLFQKYKRPQDYIDAAQEELHNDIHATGFYKNKAKSIRGACAGLITRFHGEVPSTMEDLLTLPGVGRKTANCVLGAAFGVPGIVVDTHVKRLSLRLGFSGNQDPDKIERDLQRLLPEEHWRRFSDVLIYHGRAVCRARRADHGRCAIRELCPAKDA